MDVAQRLAGAAVSLPPTLHPLTRTRSLSLARAQEEDRFCWNIVIGILISVAICIKIDEFCIKNDGFCI